MKKKSTSDFGPEGDLTKSDHVLIQAYVAQGVPLDMLAYTDKFDVIFNAMVKGGYANDDDKAIVFRRLLNLRKSGRLPRLDLSQSA
jgi:hypothetical protein